MSVADNKATYRRWFEEVVSRGDLELADEPLTPDYRLHFPGLPGPVDREGHKQLVMGFRTGFPDWVETIDDVIGDDDKVVIRVTGRGTHTGEFQGILPTGRQVTATGIGIGRLTDGRIVEAWAAYDALGLLQQVGALPAPATSGTTGSPSCSAPSWRTSHVWRRSRHDVLLHHDDRKHRQC